VFQKTSAYPTPFQTVGDGIINNELMNTDKYYNPEETSAALNEKNIKYFVNIYN
jgi:hypothetical protein